MDLFQTSHYLADIQFAPVFLKTGGIGQMFE